ncbi:hypothetical protein LguiA_035423 [Lonicera macranthoides]
MKIQCNVCEAAEATVLCCADEAALCWSCDQKVHAANKLASKHQRVSLSNSSSQMPKCDICQETVGYFFCLEDRALLCRKCDVSIHTANTYVSAHQRFLLTGVKVGLEHTEPAGASSSSGKSWSHSSEKISEPESQSFSRNIIPMSSSNQINRVLPVQGNDFAVTKLSFAGGTTGNIQQWQLDELFGLTELNQNYGYMDNASSKADSGKIGDSDCSPILRSVEVELDAEDCLGQVPDASWAVPQMPSPPTASGLYWPKTYEPSMENAAFVPDISCSRISNQYRSQSSGGGGNLKRRRQY